MGKWILKSSDNPFSRSRANGNLMQSHKILESFARSSIFSQACLLQFAFCFCKPIFLRFLPACHFKLFFCLWSRTIILLILQNYSSPWRWDNSNSSTFSPPTRLMVMVGGWPLVAGASLDEGDGSRWGRPSHLQGVQRFRHRCREIREGENMIVCVLWFGIDKYPARRFQKLFCISAYQIFRCIIITFVGKVCVLCFCTFLSNLNSKSKLIESQCPCQPFISCVESIHPDLVLKERQGMLLFLHFINSYNIISFNKGS